MTIILKSNDVDAAAKILSTGGIVAVPTNRWYMLCFNVSNENISSSVFSAKSRQLNKYFLFLIKNRNVADGYFYLSRDAQILIENFWPGDLSLMLRWRSDHFSKKHSVVGAPIALVNNPASLLGDIVYRSPVEIAATSANISGFHGDGTLGPAITLEEVIDFAKKTELEISAIIDGGICPEFYNTTIVDCSSPSGDATFVRDGVVHHRALSAALGRDVKQKPCEQD